MRRLTMVALLILFVVVAASTYTIAEWSTPQDDNTEVSSPSFVIDKPFSTTPVLYEEEKAVGMLIYDHGTREFRFEGGNVTESARLYLEELNRQIYDFCNRKGPSPDFVTGFEKGVRYGILVYMDHQDEDSLFVHTKNAMALYWLVEIKEEKE